MRYEPPKASEQEIEGAAPPGSVEAIDPFSTPIPGQSLTMEPGSQKFERPWEFTDPDDCVAFIIERMETDRAVKEEHLNLIASGVPIESIVNTTAFIGFSEGMWSPDVAELIKPPLAMYFIITAMSEDVPMVVFNPDKTDQNKMQPETMIRSMSKLNPEGYESLREGVSRSNLQQEIESGGFLGPVEETLPETEEEPVQLPDEGGMI